MRFVSLFGKAICSMGEFYHNINPSTLTGAADVLVIEDSEGNLACTSFHVRFGKLQLFRPQDKLVEVYVNDRIVNVPMKVGDTGEAFFIKKTYRENVPAEITTSPIIGTTYQDTAGGRRSAYSSYGNLGDAMKETDFMHMSLSDDEFHRPSSFSEVDGFGQAKSQSSCGHVPVYVKSLRLNNDELKSLNLVYGTNIVLFKAGRGVCGSKIYYWKNNVKIVISDVDGTITRSDKLGHIFTMMGKDWTHSGVAELFTRIKNNGYQIMYLTSRGISQAGYTRYYLKRVEQQVFRLPDGPIFMSPDRLLAVIKKEMKYGGDGFKVLCMKEIISLFGGLNPFYSGFGNRITDTESYVQVGVPRSKIFIIDSKGNIRQFSTYEKSYSQLVDIVDYMFPPINLGETTDHLYGDLHYWRNSYVPGCEGEEKDTDSLDIEETESSDWSYVD